MVLADRRSRLVQKVVANMGNLTMDGGYFGSRFPPVVAELNAPRHPTLIAFQPPLFLFVTVGRGNHQAVGQRGETNRAEIDGYDGTRRVGRFLYFPFGLDGDEPLMTVAGDGDVARLTLHRAAVAIADPAQLG